MTKKGMFDISGSYFISSRRPSCLSVYLVYLLKYRDECFGQRGRENDYFLGLQAEKPSFSHLVLFLSGNLNIFFRSHWSGCLLD